MTGSIVFALAICCSAVGRMEAGTSGQQASARSESSAKAPDSVPKLIKAVKDVGELEKVIAKGDATDVYFALAVVHGGIIGALKDVRSQGQEQAAITALLKLIDSTKVSKKVADNLTCAKSAWALGELGPVAKDAVSTLKALSKSDVNSIKTDAADALKKIVK